MWWIEVIKAVGMLGAAGLTGWLTSFAARGAAKTNEAARQDTQTDRIIDQLQEENLRLTNRVDVLEKHMHIIEDYAGDLRAHISQGSPPPPPAWPTFRPTQTVRQQREEG